MEHCPADGCREGWTMGGGQHERGRESEHTGASLDCQALPSNEASLGARASPAMEPCAADAARVG